MRLSLRVLFVLAVAVSGACTYNWTVGSTTVPSGGDSGPADAEPDGSGGQDATTGDAAFDATPPGLDAGRDAADAASEASLCATLEADLATERGPAKECTFGGTGACATYIIDECTCHSYLGLASGQAAINYTSTVAEFREAGCPPPGWCSFCLPGSGTCLYADGGASPPSCTP
ncbi:MAG: hypothetical protein ACLQBL_39395 [Polyangiaceae bacterium]